LFIFGILQDIMMGTPLGITPITLVTFQLVIDYYKRFISKKSFNIIWLGFALSSLYTILLQLIILYIFLSYSLSQLLFLLQQWYFTCLVYPIMHYIFDLIVKKCNMSQVYNA
jgi:rod shape-determining protein MreD